MTAATAFAAQREARARHRLAAVGKWGTALTVVVLGASALLRAGSAVDAAGNAASTLPAAVETAARFAHRVSASAVGVLALLAVILAASSRPAPRARIAAVAAIVALTLSLAALGRHTPGYRVAFVTAANVAGGLGLASAFLWLALQAQPRQVRDGIAWLSAAAFAVLLAHATLGAGAAAAAMRGERGLDPFHIGFGLVVLGMVAVASAHSPPAGSRRLRGALAAGVLLQLALGLLLAGGGDTRPLAATWAHAMLACALALGLLSLMLARGGGQPAA